MISKAFGGAFIIAATSKIGFDAAGKLENRRRSLKSLSSGIWLLKNDIDFTMSTLSTALKRVSRLVDKNISALFLNAAKYIDDGYTVHKSFEIALTEQMDTLKLKCEDINIILEFAYNLGNGDIDAEIRNFDKTLERLKVCESLATDNINKYCRMCKTLGITSGALFVILLM